MIQYHPTCLVENGFLITEGARGEGAHLLNSEGERFMEKYAPNKMELASRDVVSRAEQTEILEGRGVGPDGVGIYLDITVVPKKRTLEALREIVNIGKDFAGVDITKEPILIRPGQHYIMGGVKTDIDGATPIAGLYAAGEVACVSVHGGNRLGANSLLDTLIFGRRSGEHAAARARHDADADAQRRHAHARRGDDRGDPRAAEDRHAHLRDQGRARHDDEPPRRRVPRGGGPPAGARGRAAPQGGGQDRLHRRQGHVFNQDVLGAIELDYMLDCAETIVVAAIERKESRGAQFRTDYPGRNDERVAQAHRHLAQRRRRRRTCPTRR